jgi:hypothetical protein
MHPFASVNHTFERVTGANGATTEPAGALPPGCSGVHCRPPELRIAADADANGPAILCSAAAVGLASSDKLRYISRLQCY